MIAIDFKERIDELKKVGFTIEQILALAKYVGSNIYSKLEAEGLLKKEAR